MEILKHGKVYEEDLKARKVTCECGCEFRFEVSDIDHREKRVSHNWDPLNLDGWIIQEHFVRCPECGKEKDVTEYVEFKTRKN